MRSALRRLMQAALVAAAATLPAVPLAQAASPPAPGGFVAPAEPKADESNAARAKSQPGNNAPFWRGVRESGREAGVVNLPGAEQGVLTQPHSWPQLHAHIASAFGDACYGAECVPDHGQHPIHHQIYKAGAYYKDDRARAHPACATTSSPCSPSCSGRT